LAYFFFAFAHRACAALRATAPFGGQVLGASLAAAPGELGSVLSEQVRRPGHLRHD